MMLDDADMDAMIDSGVAIVGIEMRPEWRASVRLHLTISLGHAATVLATSVPDHVDPAPVFQA